MPHIHLTEIANTLMDMEFRLKDGMEHLVVKISRSNKTDFIKLKNDVYAVYNDLHAVLDTPLMGLNKVVSIQVQTTRLTGGGVQVVPMADNSATHWSVYLRQAGGEAEWVEDFIIDPKSSGRAYSHAIHAAAKLSMQHQAFIEQVK